MHAILQRNNYEEVDTNSNSETERYYVLTYMTAIDAPIEIPSRISGGTGLNSKYYIFKPYTSILDEEMTNDRVNARILL